jgi:hypothetical protein
MKGEAILKAVKAHNVELVRQLLAVQVERTSLEVEIVRSSDTRDVDWALAHGLMNINGYYSVATLLNRRTLLDAVQLRIRDSVADDVATIIRLQATYICLLERGTNIHMNYDEGERYHSTMCDYLIFADIFRKLEFAIPLLLYAGAKSSGWWKSKERYLTLKKNCASIIVAWLGILRYRKRHALHKDVVSLISRSVWRFRYEFMWEAK